MREVAIVAVAGALLMVVASLVHFLPVSLNDGVPLPATLVCRTNRADANGQQLAYIYYES